MANLIQISAANSIDLQDPAAGPRRATSLRSRRSKLAEPEGQLAALTENGPERSFDEMIHDSGYENGLRPARLEIFQINLGKLCNMTCRHCHVDAGPDRIAENMDRATVDACLRALDKTNAHTVDITGGAPELNPNFRYLVEACVGRGKHVIDRCNLTVLLLPRNADLIDWMSEQGVEVVCSLPHYRPLNTDAQRGDGTYEKSIKALKRLNSAGYGKGDPHRMLTLMSNPAGAFLAGDQAKMEGEWKQNLMSSHGISFDRLFCLNNMPISRYLEWLLEKDLLGQYMTRLTNAFNPGAVDGLMCRNTISISWDGRVFDCDFNQMLELESLIDSVPLNHIRDFEPISFGQRRVVTDLHCYGCTAGAGSSCGGATA